MEELFSTIEPSNSASSNEMDRVSVEGWISQKKTPDAWKPYICNKCTFLLHCVKSTALVHTLRLCCISRLLDSHSFAFPISSPSSQLNADPWWLMNKELRRVSLGDRQTNDCRQRSLEPRPLRDFLCLTTKSPSPCRCTAKDFVPISAELRCTYAAVPAQITSSDSDGLCGATAREWTFVRLNVDQTWKLFSLLSFSLCDHSFSPLLPVNFCSTCLQQASGLWNVPAFFFLRQLKDLQRTRQKRLFNVMTEYHSSCARTAEFWVMQGNSKVRQTFQKVHWNRFPDYR